MTGVLGWSSITADLRRASKALGDLGDLERELSLQEESCTELFGEPEREVGLLQPLDERELRLMVTPPDLFVDVGVLPGLESRVAFSWESVSSLLGLTAWPLRPGEGGGRLARGWKEDEEEDAERGGREEAGERVVA